MQNVCRPASAKAETRAGPGSSPHGCHQNTRRPASAAPKHNGKGGADGVPISINIHEY